MEIFGGLGQGVLADELSDEQGPAILTRAVDGPMDEGRGVQRKES